MTWMPQRKSVAAKEILIFDFELFIGDGCRKRGLTKAANPHSSVVLLLVYRYANSFELGDNGLSGCSPVVGAN